MKSKLFPAGAFCILLIAGFSWFVLSPGGAGWLRIEANSFASDNTPFKLKITLKQPHNGIFLGVDIHQMDADKTSKGYLTGSSAVRVSGKQETYEFSINLPVNIQSRYIFPVIYLSGDGSWKNRISSVEGGAVPVIKSGSGKSTLKLVALPAADTTERDIQPVPDSALLKKITVIAWIASSLLFSRISICLAQVTTLSAIWELTNSSTGSISLIRSIADYAGVYSLRKTPQQFASIIVISALAFIAVYIISSAKSFFKSVSLGSITIFWSVSLLQLISLHRTDSLLSGSFAGSNTGQFIRLASSMLCLISLTLITMNPSDRHHQAEK